MLNDRHLKICWYKDNTEHAMKYFTATAHSQVLDFVFLTSQTTQYCAKCHLDSSLLLLFELCFYHKKLFHSCVKWSASQSAVNWIVKLGGRLNSHLVETRADLKHSSSLTVSGSGNLRYFTYQEALISGTQWHASALTHMGQISSICRAWEKQSCPWITAGVLPRGCISCARAVLKSSS